MLPELDSFDRTRRQLVLWSAILLFFTLTGVQLGTLIDADLDGVASALRIVENPRVIPACLTLVILYFFFRLIVVWWQIPHVTRTERGWPLTVDCYVAGGIACLSLVVFVGLSSGYFVATSGKIVPLSASAAGLALIVLAVFVFLSLAPQTRQKLCNKLPTAPPAHLATMQQHLCQNVTRVFAHRSARIVGSALLLLVAFGICAAWWKLLVTTESRYRSEAASSPSSPWKKFLG